MILTNTIIRLLITLFLINTAYAGLDSHIHFLSHEKAEVEKYRGVALKNGITHSFVLSMAYSSPVREIIGPYEDISYDEFIQTQNTFVASVQKKYPKEFTSFCSIPWGYERSKALRELSRCVSLGLKGLKVYPVKFYMTESGRYNALNIRFDSSQEDLEFLNLLIDFANEHRLIFGIHSSQIDSSGLIGFLYQSNYRYTPNLKLIFFHAFASQSLAVLNLVRDHLSFMPESKIFIELSSSKFYADAPFRKQFRRILKLIGSERILFGSDGISWSDYQEQSDHLEMYRKLLGRRMLREILSNTRVFE